MTMIEKTLRLIASERDLRLSGQASLVRQHLDERDGIAFVWIESEKCLAVFPTQRATEEHAEYQILLPSVSPLFDVDRVCVSETTRYALLSGRRGMAVVELPRRWGGDGQFEGGKKQIHCRTILLDDTYLSYHTSVNVRQAEWFPESSSDTHVIALFSDDYLRFYDINEPFQPMLRMSLIDRSSEKKSSDGRDSTSNISRLGDAVMGQSVVGFDIAAANSESVAAADSSCSIYALQENGDVWLLHCRLLYNRFEVDPVGPLSMFPCAADNYGGSYCSILVMDTTPSVIAMVTRKGRVHHCIVLEDGEVDDSSMTPRRSSYSDVSLYVYESVQLELQLVSSADQTESADQTDSQPEHIQLLRDPSNASRYLCTSRAGVHSIMLPWLQDIEKFMLPEDDYGASYEPEITSPAEVVYLLCTRPSQNSPSISTCGCLVDSAESALLCLLCSGEVTILPLRRVPAQVPQDDSSESSTEAGKFTSPLRKLKAVGSFDHHIQRILNKSATVPLLKCGGGDQLVSADEYYELLTRSTQILREEYLEKLLTAKNELEKRCTLLSRKRREQQLELSELTNQNELAENAERLAGKLDTCQETMKTTVDRLSTALRTIQQLSPVLSTEEKEWAQECETMRASVVKLSRHAQLIKTKHENSILRQPVDIQARAPSAPIVGTKQAIRLRAVLKEQDGAIDNLIGEVQSLGLSVGS